MLNLGQTTRWVLVLAVASLFSPARADEAGSKPAAPSQNSAEKTEDQELGAKILRLIKRLGAEEYASRERAQVELSLLGLAAFDALNRACDHTDVEIATRAKYLVRSMKVEWANDDDPMEVQRIFQSFDSLPESERRSRIERLALLDDWAGSRALVRLAKYERSPRLSKHAALLLMGQSTPEDEQRREALAASLRESVGDSQRTAAAWVRTYADTLTDPAATVDAWSLHVQQERDVFSRFPDKSGSDIVRDLYRWQADFLESLGRDADVLEAVRQSLTLLPEDRKDLLEAIEWLLEREAWDVVREVALRFSRIFNSDATLLYRLATAQKGAGDADAAKQTADKAFKLHLEDRGHRIRMGLDLRRRGLYGWAEREYRDAFDPEADDQDGEKAKKSPLPLSNRDIDGLRAIQARVWLAEMLHGELENLKSAQVLLPLIDAFDKDGAAERWLHEYFQVSFRGNMHFYYAEHYRLSDIQKQKHHLEKAVGLDPTNADILIAMYRLAEADEPWRSKTKQLIDQTAKEFTGLMEKYRGGLTDADEGDKDDAKRELAIAENQYAWLISNTEGDFAGALAASIESNELRPNHGGHLDTLGRCYFAMGDLDNAIKHQRAAVELEPHMGAIVRQLRFFEKKKAEASETSP